MRSERIKIKDESLASRTRLYNFLRSVNEPIYKLTSLLDITQYYSIFEYHAGYWGSSGGSATMSINDFIAKYSPKTKPKIKEATPMIIKNLPPGTKVRVRDDLKKDERYYTIYSKNYSRPNEDMVTYKGVVVTIKTQLPSGDYRLKEIDHYWTDEMFSEIITTTEKPPTHKFKVGDTVKFKPGIKSDDIFNNITIVIVENMDTIALSVSKLDKDTVMLSNEFWYGIDALELVPIEQKTSTKKPPKSKPTTTIAKNEESVAQPEPIKSIKKEETFMSRLKEVTKQTGTQNIEAAKIAAKMEAGRIINKQVIKQAKPHVPMLLRGYLDTPLAPVILANAVAMLGNHTGNAKVQKVSELMLLAAADVTVQSFNLDKIINDVLSGIKLPAGILDDEE